MIEKMYKYAFLVYHKEYKAFLEGLREFGAVHITQFNPTNEHPVIQELKEQHRRVKNQLNFFDELLTRNKSTESVQSIEPIQSIPSLLSRVEALREDASKLRSSISLLEKEREAFVLWGDFSYETIGKMRESGYVVSFFTCPESHYNEAWEKTYNALKINTFQSTVYFVTITRIGAVLPIDADRAKLPLKDYRNISDEIEQTTRQKEEVEKELLKIARTGYASLKSLSVELENETEWNGVMAQTSHEAADKLMFIEGWIPADKRTEMTRTLDAKGYFYQNLEITDEDNIPIKLKNNRFTRLFEPLTQMYSMPNYKEFDPTPLFAPFFMLFFGLCFGDGGYGLLLVLAALFLKPKVSESLKPILSLVLYFGIATMVVGLLTGSCFGFSIAAFSTFASVKKYFLTSDNLMIISLVIGFFHVVYAKIIAAMKIKIQRGLKYSLSAFAWIFVIVSSACVLVLPKANIHLPQTVEYALYGIAGLSALVALFYNTPGKNVFLNFGSGLWNTYNTVSGLVGDVLSYIRLYAIGLTSALLGGVFNTMAIDLTASMNPFIRWLPMLLILLVGHALNFGLGIISSLVHPLRLIYVEYYKNSEFEGGGIDYKPFTKK